MAIARLSKEIAEMEAVIAAQDGVSPLARALIVLDILSRAVRTDSELGEKHGTIPTTVRRRPGSRNC
jgi:hypothetical protein